MPKLKKPPSVDFRSPTTDWLNSIQNALINTQGVFLIRNMPHSVFYYSEKRIESSWPAYSKLARRICKVYLLATQHHPYALHAGLDVFDGPQNSHSIIKKCSSVNADPEIYSGLFNIVYGREEDLSGLEVFIKGSYWDCKAYFQDLNEEFGCVVIPGFTLEAFDDCFSAVKRRIVNGNMKKEVVSYQCRLNPGFVLPDGRNVKVATEVSCQEKNDVKEEPNDFITVEIKSSCGSYSATLHADQTMTPEELKTVFVQHTKWKVNPQDIGLISHNGVGYFFEGSCLKDLAVTAKQSEGLKFTAHLRNNKSHISKETTKLPK